jgi:hypothetical protein
MRAFLIRAGALALVATAALGLVAADEGMWLFNNPPAKLLKERYGFEPAREWLEHLQKSSVRFSTGGSGSIVSRDGLVMTNHHVGSDVLEKLSTPEKNLLETGFYARTLEEEIPAGDLELRILWTIEDVTPRVEAAATGKPAAEANQARMKAMTELEDEAEAATGLDCEVVTLYKGGRYHLYGYKRYADVRLVMAPEGQIAFFGGDVDNFEYPRYDLDVTFFRIWEDGKPLKPEHWLSWSEAGAAEGDLVFVAGHPGSTQRLYTMAHLDFLRDVRYPHVLHFLWRREVKLKTFSERSEENERTAHGEMFGVQNSRKAYTGMQAGLLDPAIWNAKQEAESVLRAKVDALAESKAKWGDAWVDLAAAEQRAAELYVRYLALGSRGMSLGGELFGIARHLVRLAAEKEKANPERLREYRESELDSLFLELYSPAPIHEPLEIERMTSSLTFMAELLGGDDPLVVQALDGRSPADRAQLLVRGTRLGDVAERKRLAEGGRTAVEASKDPMIQLARRLDPDARTLRKSWEDSVESVENASYARIAAAKFAFEGEDVYPDATFTLRLAFGTVKGYEENGQRVEPFTRLAGLYERAEARDEKAFDLPPRWIERREALELSTPMNFVSTCDIVGGNSGSPVVDRKGEVVGLIFDGNIHSLVLSIAYTDEQARAVSVDSRAIVEALRKVYDAGALAEELTRR